MSESIPLCLKITYAHEFDQELAEQWIEMTQAGQVLRVMKFFRDGEIRAASHDGHVADKEFWERIPSVPKRECGACAFSSDLIACSLFEDTWRILVSAQRRRA
ncbi:hypothetical protein FP2506_10066 [Fulvimarina pelagi HTCC2506]|uniref:Uncharacterized protein n=1 Tax=Fulvimarina pelagi HTCC2506 TaxID=314231 RepID=Q0G583_9HYPH|nr:hypothetical protein [Fulvimarina pelagi]EAU43181.1 hypothetical protein FP2506_10066 [Fulvimarina pelagi HTCC2506]